MSFELSNANVEHFYAWVVVENERHHYLAGYYKGTDGFLHWEYRLATATEEGQELKTFESMRKPLPATDDEVRKEAERASRARGRRSPRIMP